MSRDLHEERESFLRATGFQAGGARHAGAQEENVLGVFEKEPGASMAGRK